MTSIYEIIILDEINWNIDFAVKNTNSVICVNYWKVQNSKSCFLGYKRQNMQMILVHA